MKLIKQVESQFSSKKQSEGLLSPLEGLLLLRHTKPTTLEATCYEPTICLILQGRKEILIGEKLLGLGTGESLIVSYDLPVTSCITEASTERPYLAMVIPLNMTTLRSLYKQATNAGLDFESEDAGSLQSDHTDTLLLETLSRFLDLADSPLESKVLAPLLLKELHFRLIMASHGGMLRQLLRQDSHASRISQAIEQIRENFRIPLSIPEIAKTVGMSSSSFHKYFKSITLTTPLQYQKSLRLLEARRLLSEGLHNVNTAAFAVGYESPTQFSREYTRKFGASPRHDINKEIR